MIYRKRKFNFEHLQAELSERLFHLIVAVEGGRAQDSSSRWFLNVPQEAKTLVQKLLAGPEVEQLLCHRGDPAVRVEDALTDLHEC